MDRSSGRCGAFLTRWPRRAGLAALVTVVLNPINSAFAQLASCEPATLRMAATRDFKASPQGRSLIFETLVALDNRGKPTPYLATSWETSADGRSYTFELRHDVRFSDGTAFVAETAAYSVRLAAERAGFGRYLERVDVSGPHQLQIRLTRPYWPLLTELAFEHLSKMVDPAGAVSDAYRGTGPFVLVHHEPDVGAELVANPDYWGAKPQIDEIAWTTLQEPMEHIAALKAGQVDVIGATEHHGALPYQAFDELLGDPRFETRFRSYGRHQVLDFNVNHPMLAEVEVRQAINAGINRDRLVEELMSGIPSAEHTLNPPRPDWPLGPPQGGQSLYDPDRSRQLLDSAGWRLAETRDVRYRDGTPLELGLLVNGFESNAVAAAHFIVDALGRIGIRARIDPVPGALVGDRLKSGDFDIHVSHSCSMAQLGCLSAGGKYTRFNDTNGLFTSPELAGLIDDALGAAAMAEREAAFEALWQALAENVVGAPLFDVVKPMAHPTNVQGVEFGSTVLTIDLSNATIEPASTTRCLN